MIDVVIDSNVVLRWLRPHETPLVPVAGRLLDAHRAGRIRVVAPFLLPFEVMNVAGRKWRLEPTRLVEVATWLGLLRFDLVVPPLPDVARWMAVGLSAYDASYVAVAEAAGAELITADGEILAVAPGIARALADASASPGVAG